MGGRGTGRVRVPVPHPRIVIILPLFLRQDLPVVIDEHPRNDPLIRAFLDPVSPSSRFEQEEITVAGRIAVIDGGDVGAVLHVVHEKRVRRPVVGKIDGFPCRRILRMEKKKFRGIAYRRRFVFDDRGGLA